MNEWAVVGVLVVLAGLVATIVKPMISLNTTITKLTTVVDMVKDNLKELTSNNSESHKRLWDKNGEQDEKLSDHERRLSNIEKRGEVK